MKHITILDGNNVAVVPCDNIAVMFLDTIDAEAMRGRLSISLKESVGKSFYFIGSLEYLTKLLDEWVLWIETEKNEIGS